MGSKAEGTASVIEKLMGIDDLPNHHPVRERGRVLSEKYFQRVASIGVRARSSCPVKYSFVGTQHPEEFGTFYSVVGRPRQDILDIKKTQSKKLRLNRYAKSRRVEKTSNVSETFYVPPHIPTKLVLLRPGQGAEEISSRQFYCLRSSKTSGAVQMNCRDSHGPLRHCRDSSYGIGHLGQRPQVSSEEVEEVSNEMKFNNIHSRSSSNRSLVSTPNSSYIAREAKKEILERFTKTKGFQELGSGSKGKSLGEMPSVHSEQMGSRIVNSNSHDSGRGMKSGARNVNRFKTFKVSQRPFETGDLLGEKNVAILSAEESEISGSSLGASTSLWEILEMSSQIECISLCNSSGNLPKQDESSQFLEEDSASMHSSIGPESFKSFEETYQPSPDSVLELFDLRNDLDGIPFELKSLGVRLEEHMMTLSNDGDDQASNFKEAEDFMRFSKAEEKRNFLYLVNVLSEAGLSGGSLTENLVKWQSTESPLSSLIFEVIEKKYGERESGWRSDRKLLYDRINLGLTEVLLQGTVMPSWAKPISARVNSRPVAEVTEDDLWALLVRQENEARKESEDVLGDDLGWSDIGECIDLVCRDIEDSLVEEFAQSSFSLVDKLVRFFPSVSQSGQVVL